MPWRFVDATTQRPLTWDEGDWPCFIHGAERSGASFSTIILTAELVRRGQNVAFLCARAEAVLALERELRLDRPKVRAKAVTRATASPLAESQLVTMHHDRGEFLLRSLRALSDWSERIVVVKNVERVLTPGLWSVLQTHPRLILSGDAGRLPINLPTDHFFRLIGFSTWPDGWSMTRPANLPKYAGHMIQRGQERTVIALETEQIK